MPPGSGIDIPRPNKRGARRLSTLAKSTRNYQIPGNKSENYRAAMTFRRGPERFTFNRRKRILAAQNQLPLTILRRKQVEARTGLSRSTIYAKLRRNPNRPSDYDPTFPKPVSMGAKAVGWIESELDAWLTAQIAKSRKA